MLDMAYFVVSDCFPIFTELFAGLLGYRCISASSYKCY